jgi:hypothetical protein
MKKFLTRLFTALFLPILTFGILLIVYFNIDPYQDFGNYPNYSWKYLFQSLGDISTKKIIKNQFKYDSYILGSSRTTGFYACYLSKKIDGSHFYHYGNFHESIGGIYEKLKLIEKNNAPIKNVLILFDNDCTFENNGKPTKHDHFLINGIPKHRYYYNHFSSFISNPFNMKLLFGGKLNAESFPNFESDCVTNDFNHNCKNYNLKNYDENKISTTDKKNIDSLLNISSIRVNFKQQYLVPQISSTELIILQEIKKILTKHHTNYYIIISPTLDKLKFHISDSIKIKNIFEDKVFDFSGVNKYTNNSYNYPDLKHFRDWISREIIDSITQKQYNLPTTKKQ